MSARSAALLLTLALGACGQPSAGTSPVPHLGDSDRPSSQGDAPTSETSQTPKEANVLGATLDDHVAHRAPKPAQAPHVILVTIDGARWQDVFEGIDRTLATQRGYDRQLIETLAKPNALTPRVHELVAKNGIALGRKSDCGIVRQASNTNISLPGYYEIFTARRTRCMSNVCPAVSMPTILDRAAMAGIGPVASIASWDALDRAVTAPFGKGSPHVFVSAGSTKWGGHRPLDDARLERAVADGEKSGPNPALEGKYRPDRHTGAIALEYIRLHRPRFLHIGLGDTDEWGHRDDYGNYLTALREADAFLGNLADLLSSMDLFESTTVIVTADHGRARTFKEHGYTHPESGRSFVIAFGGKAPAKGIDACARRNILLPDVGATVRALFALPKDEAPDAGRPIEDLLE